MGNSRKALVNDEWIVVVLGFIVLALSVLFPDVMNSFKIPGILAAQSASALGSLQGWLGAVYIFVFVLALLYLAQALTGKPFKGIFLDLARFLDVAVSFVAGEPDAALAVRFEVETNGVVEPAEGLHLTGKRVVKSNP